MVRRSGHPGGSWSHGRGGNCDSLRADAAFNIPAMASRLPALIRGTVPALVLALVLALALLMARPGLIHAQSSGGAACLQIMPGARADAMGNADVALASDATSIWWNPAALADRSDRVVSLMHTQLVPDLADDVYYENLGFATKGPGRSGLGASLIYLTYGRTQVTDASGNPRGAFTSWEASPQVAMGTEIVPGLAIGATLKYVYIMLAPDWAASGLGKGTGNSFGADFGLLASSRQLLPSLPVPVHVGVNLQNLGPDISFVNTGETDPMPRNLKAGIAAQLLNGENFTGTVAYDFNKPLVYSSDRPIHNLGAELSYRKMIAARIGYIHDKQGDIMDLTYGAGFSIPFQSSKISLDYASVPQSSVLSRVSRFSLSLGF